MDFVEFLYIELKNKNDLSFEKWFFWFLESFSQVWNVKMYYKDDKNDFTIISVEIKLRI